MNVIDFAKWQDLIVVSTYVGGLVRWLGRNNMVIHKSFNSLSLRLKWIKQTKINSINNS